MRMLPPDFFRSSASTSGCFRRSRQMSVTRHLEAAPFPRELSRARVLGGSRAEGKGENDEK